MRKKVIITGCSGFIGSALAKHLEKDYEIIGIDREKWLGKEKSLFYHQDINDKLPDFKNIYTVIHLAARPGVRNSHELFNEVCKDNILGTQNIIKKCIEDWKSEKLLIASSSSVYGDNGNDGHKLCENEKRNPKSPYAMSKCATEDLLTTYKNCGMLDNINCSLLRFFTVYGPNQRSGLSIRAFTDWILRDQPITLYGTGEQKRDFTHIDDICEGILGLLECENSLYDIYNIGSEKSHSINKVIHMIANHLGKNVTINYQPRNVYDVDMTLANTSRLYETTGWIARKDFEDGLKEQIEWQKKQLDLEK